MARKLQKHRFPKKKKKTATTTATSVIPPPPPTLSGRSIRSGWNATALAYLGDAVWELYARRAHFSPPKRLTALYDLVTASVRAEAQAAFAEALEAGGFLSDEEKDVLRWGKNAKVTVPKRFVGGKEKDRGPRGGGGKGKWGSNNNNNNKGNVSSAAAEAAANKSVAVSGPHANVYRSATALECLVGYLYVADPRRLHAVMRYVGLGGPEEEDGEEGGGGVGGLAAAVLASVGGGGRGGGNSASIGADDDESSISSA